MLSLNDIKKAAAAKLSAQGMRVFDERVGESDFSKGEVVCLMLYPAGAAAAGGIIKKSLIIECLWMKSECAKREEIYDALDSITNLMGSYLTVGDRAVKINSC